MYHQAISFARGQEVKQVVVGSGRWIRIPTLLVKLYLVHICGYFVNFNTVIVSF